MNGEPVFTPIDMNAWPMAQCFYYYTQMASTSYSVNVDMDVSVMRRRLKEHGYKFFRLISISSPTQYAIAKSFAWA